MKTLSQKEQAQYPLGPPGLTVTKAPLLSKLTPARHIGQAWVEPNWS